MTDQTECKPCRPIYRFATSSPTRLRCREVALPRTKNVKRGLVSRHDVNPRSPRSRLSAQFSQSIPLPSPKDEAQLLPSGSPFHLGIPVSAKRRAPPNASPTIGSAAQPRRMCRCLRRTPPTLCLLVTRGKRMPPQSAVAWAAAPFCCLSSSPISFGGLASTSFRPGLHFLHG